jgi:spectinomycin phosphotransferase
VREPPPDVSDDAVLSVVREHWAPAADAVEHLPVGFGAHHWAASSGGRRTHFVTLDALGSRHSAQSIEASYGTAAALARDLDFVVQPLPSARGAFTVPLGRGAVSASAWCEGTPPETMDADVTAGLLDRLHTTTPPDGTPAWTTLVSEDLADDLRARCSTPWTSGPYAERARSAVRARLDAVAEWTATYLVLAEVACGRPWVVTHGEPDEGNQLLVDGRTLLLDWESVKLAPVERDLRTFVERGGSAPAIVDPAMLELFDLEWRLDEIAGYATWFESPHTGTASDRIAVGGLLHELTRSSITVP